ncbi:MAG: DMT family transporter [Lachnospiraceae bacterium]|nr:DMT family transporter [Lachnospiraceae bacterium]
MKETNKFKFYAAVILGNVFWGISNMLTKIGISYADPEVLLTCRFLTAFIILTVMMIVQKVRIDLRKKSFRSFLTMITAEPLQYLSESYGLAFSNAAFSGVVASLSPIAGTGLAAIFLKEFPSRRKVLFSLLPILGVIIITLDGNRIGYVQPLGVVLLFLAMLLSAVYRTANRGASQDYTPLERTWSVFLTCTTTFIVVALVRNHGDLSVYAEACRHPEFVASFVSLALLSSVAAHMLVNYGYAYMSVLTISTFAMLQNVIAIFSGIVFLHEPLTGAIVIGTILILSGIFIVNRTA